MADAGESDDGALPPGNPEPSTQVARSMTSDCEAPGHDLPEHAPGPVAGEGAPAIADANSSRQQSCAPLQALPVEEQFRQFQWFMSKFPNGIPVEFLQALASSASAPAPASTTISQIPESSSTLAASHVQTSVEAAYACASQSVEDPQSLCTGIKIESGSSSSQIQAYPVALPRSQPETQEAAPPASQKKRKMKDVSFETSDDSEDSDYDLCTGQDQAKSTRYNPLEDEKEPMTQIHHPSFRKAEMLHTAIYRRILDVIEEYGCEGDSDIQFLWRYGHEYIRIAYPPAVNVGLRGEMGEGKSSLVNSLLAVNEEIAAKSGGIRACTSVVQEFRAPASDQGTSFQTEIEFLPDASRKAALVAYLADFFDFQENDPKEGEDVHDQLSVASSACLDALATMFANHKECKDVNAVGNFLKSSKGRNDPTLTGRLLAWLRENMRALQVDLETNKIVISTNDPGSLSRRLEPFLKSSARYSEDDERLPSLWPLVRHVRTSLDSPLLKQGIVLVDLPGTGDINQTRTMASNNYMRKVDHTIVVARMDRIGSNRVIYQELRNSLRRGKSGNSIVVITKADEVVPGVSPSHDLKPPGKPGKKFAALAKQILANLKSINDLKCRAEMARRQGNRQSRRELMNQRANLVDTDKDVRRQYYETVRSLRDKIIAQSIREQYTTLTRDEAFLPVFCVSNTVYRDWVLGREPTTLGGMTVEQTNIPALRRHLYRLPALKKFEALDNQCKNRLGIFLAMIDMICVESKIERMSALDKIIAGPRKVIKEVISAVYEELQSKMFKSVLKKIKTSRTKWIEAAERNLEKWSHWSDPTYKAVCRHGGSFKSKRYNEVDWNADLLKPVENDLKNDLAKWNEAPIALCGRLCEEFECMMNQLRSDLEGKAGAAKDYLEAFFTVLDNTKGVMFELAEEAGERLGEELSRIKEQITNASYLNQNYLIASLKPTYQTCAEIRNKGAHEKRVNTLGDFVRNSQKGPYMAINTGVGRDTRKVFPKLAKDLVEKVLGQFDHTHRIFNTNFNTNEEETPEAKAIRERLRMEIGPARDVADGALKQFLDDCRNAGTDSSSQQHT